ncbi:MAG: hypothetical protein ABL857_02095 [Rickettsiales bacterium]
MKKEKSIIRYSANNLPNVTEKDRKLLRSASRKAIDFSDIPDITSDEATRAYVIKIENLSVVLAPEVASFYKKLGNDCQDTINSVLKAYMLVQEHRV